MQTKVQSGQYNSASEVVQEALRLMEQRDERREVQLQEVRLRIDQGLEFLDRGEGVDGEAFLQNLLDDLDSQAKRKAG